MCEKANSLPKRILYVKKSYAAIYRYIFITSYYCWKNITGKNAEEFGFFEICKLEEMNEGRESKINRRVEMVPLFTCLQYCTPRRTLHALIYPHVICTQVAQEVLDP